MQHDVKRELIFSIRIACLISFGSWFSTFSL